MSTNQDNQQAPEDHFGWGDLKRAPVLLSLFVMVSTSVLAWIERPESVSSMVAIAAICGGALGAWVSILADSVDTQRLTMKSESRNPITYWQGIYLFARTVLGVLGGCATVYLLPGRLQEGVATAVVVGVAIGFSVDALKKVASTAARPT